jgi:hypothetical protein
MPFILLYVSGTDRYDAFRACIRCIEFLHSLASRDTVVSVIEATVMCEHSNIIMYTYLCLAVQWRVMPLTACVRCRAQCAHYDDVTPGGILTKVQIQTVGNKRKVPVDRMRADWGINRYFQLP